MKARNRLCTLALSAVVALPSSAWADNPIVQTFYTADPAPMVHEGRLYLYTSHDEDVTVSDFYTMNDWKLYSTIDMVNWTDHGTVAGLKTFSWSTDNAWAPQAVARNGKIYLYVPLNNNTGAKIGVAVADNPLGPFTDPLGKALAASGSGNIDPTVFIDDDGQAYMYWGNGTLRYVKLGSDMISTSGSITNVSLSGFTEGPWFYKRGELYYLIYAATSGSEKLSYATSNSPTGPWNIRGDIMPPGNTFTNHAGVADYKGHSYFFYHNSALPGGNNYKRSVCVEEFKYGADGSIPSIPMTKDGPEPLEALNPFLQVEAETIAFSSGLKTEACTDTGGGINVSAISNGDYIKVKNVDFADGVTSFEARVSSSSSDAKIELHLDSQTGTLLGTCDVSGASSWTTKTCSVSGGSGRHDLYLKFVGGSGELFKFNWWKFSGPTMPNTGGTGAGGNAGSGGGGGSGSGASGNAGVAGSTSGGAPAGNGGVGAGPGSAGSSSGGSGVSTGGANAAGTGGAAGLAGSAPAGGGTNGAADADSGGCSCRTAASAGNTGLAAAVVMAASALVRRRRRR